MGLVYTQAGTEHACMWGHRERERGGQINKHSRVVDWDCAREISRLLTHGGRIEREGGKEGIAHQRCCNWRNDDRDASRLDGLNAINKFTRGRMCL